VKPVPKSPQNLHDKIRNRARELFFSQGYDHTDMRQIAQECGIAVGTLYNYFSGKEALFAAIREQSVEEFEQSIQRFLSVPRPFPRNLKEFSFFLLQNFIDSIGLWKGFIEVSLLKNINDFFLQVGNLSDFADLNRAVEVMTGMISEHYKALAIPPPLHPYKTAKSLLMTIFGLCIEPPEEISHSLQFLDRFLQTLFESKDPRTIHET